jgi:pimeloyl-ACP methyl ester carboxylesterase
MSTLPALEGVEHKFVEVGEGVTIHVADAGPADGPVVMLVHGFPQNWWEWNELIGPLAADGYRVLCPDLRGSGWSSAPRSLYTKDEMAGDLAVVLDKLGIDKLKLAAHDWGGPVAFILMLRHPERVTGFFGMNTVAPYVKTDFSCGPQPVAALVSDPDFAAGGRSTTDRRPQGAVRPFPGVVGRRRIQPF